MSLNLQALTAQQHCQAITRPSIDCRIRTRFPPSNPRNIMYMPGMRTWHLKPHIGLRPSHSYRSITRHKWKLALIPSEISQLTRFDDVVSVTRCPCSDDLLINQEPDFEGQFEDLGLELLIGGMAIYIEARKGLRRSRDIVFIVWLTQKSQRGQSKCSFKPRKPMRLCFQYWSSEIWIHEHSVGWWKATHGQPKYYFKYSRRSEEAKLLIWSWQTGIVVLKAFSLCGLSKLPGAVVVRPTAAWSYGFWLSSSRSPYGSNRGIIISQKIINSNSFCNIFLISYEDIIMIILIVI